MTEAETLNFLVNNWWLLAAISIWTIPWKGWALWKASKRNEPWWFVILLVLNTAGILEIIYIFFITKRKKQLRLDL
ncbi:MAG: hypothetical protein A2114_02915 [Candidatus Vogelbacteria bacterium GWA1_51_14]|uniref:DUF5652 domain-containing protein n=1 Tax=Candidatus Vogelbacteria bacterium GWA1_51_14 TaxID=1802435 RepID=A0A1G2Q9C0_9BACT|nr:MAG: hypothetical protein A2114_02915 [Candidatus Vogelbacteria bacterium GWA1_51_14]